MKQTSRIGREIARLLDTVTLRTNSLIVTLFGDAIAPRCHTVWLGSLIDLAAPLGINDRAIRTAVFRLLREGWLHTTPIGRRSAYGLTDAGLRRIHHAYRRIYDTPDETWNGEWQIVILPEGGLPPKDREALRRDLGWDGYGTIAPGVLAHPSRNTGQLRELLRQSGHERSVMPLTAALPEGVATEQTRSLVHSWWRLDKLAEDYQRFIARFRPALSLLQDGEQPTPEQHYVLRTLLIHEFRRVQLRDPQLPQSLLSAKWQGHEARRLCREIYAHALAPSEHYLSQTLKTPDGNLPEAAPSLYERFGGLEAGGRMEGAAGALAGAPARNRTRS